MQLDNRNACLRGQFPEPLGHVVRVPRPPVGLAEDQIVVLPRWPGLHPRPQLRLVVRPQQVRRLRVQEPQAVAGLALGRRLLVQLPAELEDRPLHGEHTPVKVGEGPPEPA
jgi:hypothetical protein